MKANENIVARVAELQARAVEGVILTREWVIERLIENANRAMELKDGSVANGSVANRALELLGKELGMFVEHSENRNVNYIVSPEMPPEEWEAKYCEPLASAKLLISRRLRVVCACRSTPCTSRACEPGLQCPIASP